MDEKQAGAIINEAQAKQEGLISHFLSIIENGDLSHAYLFSGGLGDGKLAVAKTIAMRLFCPNLTEDGMPCGKCQECLRIAADEHPDVLVVKPDGNSIKVDQVREIKSEFSKSAVEGNKKVFIIADTETMTKSAANGLLKFIEEPFGNINTFLLTSDYQKILPTIVSRTQLVEFPKVNKKQLEEYASKKGLAKTTINLALDLTDDTYEIDLMCENNWLSRAKSQVEKWFELIADNDFRAFPMVSTNFIKLGNDKLHFEKLLAIIYQVFRDVFDVKFKEKPADQLAFGDIYETLNQVSNLLSGTQVIDIIEMILKAAQKQNINVSMQNILEVITLKCLDETKA